jgi:hypothetical protein
LRHHPLNRLVYKRKKYNTIYAKGKEIKIWGGETAVLKMMI